MKTAFLFPGQGSQFVGMGEAVYDLYPEARSVFDEANKNLGEDLKKLCFQGPAEDLALTINTQPAILTVSIALLRVLQRNHVRPDFVAGHSLGEYSALVAAEVMTFSDAIKVVRARADYMQCAVAKENGAMAAVLGWTEQQILDLLKILDMQECVFIANLNCPGQIVISGEKVSLDIFIQKALEAGVRRCLRLEVSIPSHCPLMNKAGKKLEEYLKTIQFGNAQIPVMLNTDAQAVTDQTIIRSALIRQLSSPVKWEASIRNLIANGVELFIEIGPGKVLSNLVRRIDQGVKTISMGEQAGIDQALSMFRV